MRDQIKSSSADKFYGFLISKSVGQTVIDSEISWMERVFAMPCVREDAMIIGTLTPGVAKLASTSEGLIGYLWEITISKPDGDILSGAECFLQVNEQDKFIELYMVDEFTDWREDSRMGFVVLPDNMAH